MLQGKKREKYEAWKAKRFPKKEIKEPNELRIDLIKEKRNNLLDNNFAFIGCLSEKEKSILNAMLIDENVVTRENNGRLSIYNPVWA